MLRCPYETKKGEGQRTTKKTLGPIAKTHCIVFSLSVAAFSSLVRDGALILSFLLSFCFSFSRRKRYILSASKFATQASKPSKKDLNMKSEEATIEIQLLQIHRNTTLQLERGEKKRQLQAGTKKEKAVTKHQTSFQHHSKTEPKHDQARTLCVTRETKQKRTPFFSF